jgi:hypothetical protein
VRRKKRDGGSLAPDVSSSIPHLVDQPFFFEHGLWVFWRLTCSRLCVNYARSVDSYRNTFCFLVKRAAE